MSQVKNRFARGLPQRNLRKLYVISAEGAVTERQYFEYFKKFDINIHIIKKKNKSAPKHVLNELKRYLKANKLDKNDEAWVVIDKDDWPQEQLARVKKWEISNDCHHVAISIPNFEYWLLLHFEDGNKITSKCNDRCSKLLKEYLGEYDKQVDMTKISKKQIADAIMRSKKRCSDSGDDHGMATTDVHMLVEKWLNNLN